MPEVLVALSFRCGCAEALVDDCGRLVNCTVDSCRGHWWCECADPEDPRRCWHVTALLMDMEAA